MRESYLRPLLWLTAIQAVVTLLAGLNLVIPAMATRVGVGEFVRWREMFSLLFVTPASAGLMVMAIWLLERGRGDSWGPLLAITVSICMVAVSMGVHEPINVVGRGAGDRLRETVFFWDEVFSHAAFFAGFAGVSLSLIWGQARNPLGAAMGRGVFLAFLGCGLVAGVGIFFSLVRAPDIRIDLVIIAVVIGLAEWLRRGRSFGHLPLAVALETGYALALAGLLLRGR
jgi:hypothetical protein